MTRGMFPYPQKIEIQSGAKKEECHDEQKAPSDGKFVDGAGTMLFHWTLPAARGTHGGKRRRAGAPIGISHSKQNEE